VLRDGRHGEIEDFGQVTDAHFFVCMEEIKDSEPLAVPSQGKKVGQGFQPVLI
jgi:hypothetical protein